MEDIIHLSASPGWSTSYKRKNEYVEITLASTSLAPYRIPLDRNTHSRGRARDTRARGLARFIR